MGIKQYFRYMVDDSFIGGEASGVIKETADHPKATNKLYPNFIR